MRGVELGQGVVQVIKLFGGRECWKKEFLGPDTYRTPLWCPHMRMHMRTSVTFGLPNRSCNKRGPPLGYSLVRTTRQYTIGGSLGSLADTRACHLRAGEGKGFKRLQRVRWGNNTSIITSTCGWITLLEVAGRATGQVGLDLSFISRTPHPASVGQVVLKRTLLLFC